MPTPLIDLAADSLALALTVSGQAVRPEPARLRAAALARLDAFAAAAAAEGVPPETLATADLLLAALIDRLATLGRGGASDAWRARPLAGERHPGADPDAAAEALLDAGPGEPRARALLELLAVCDAFGLDDAGVAGERFERARSALESAAGPPAPWGPA